MTRKVREKMQGMRQSRVAARAAAAACVLALAGVACGGGGGGGGDLTGTVKGDGSSTVFPITQAIAEEFQGEQPNVKVPVGTSGTGGGFKKFCAGETDLQNASRPIKDDEKTVCAKNGVEYVELEVAIDGLSVVVNKTNTWARCLTVAELKKVWDRGSKVKSWKDVRAGFPDKPLSLYGPGTDSGTFDYFTEEINGDTGRSRSDYTASENDNDLVQGVKGDEGALGYFGYAYYIENKDALNVVAVDGGSGCVQPTEKAINDGSYKPLSRPLYVYVAKKAAARKEVQEFMGFYLESVNEVLGDVGYIPTPRLAQEKAEWEQLVASA